MVSVMDTFFFSFSFSIFPPSLLCITGRLFVHCVGHSSWNRVLEGTPLIPKKHVVNSLGIFYSLVFKSRNKRHSSGVTDKYFEN